MWPASVAACCLAAREGELDAICSALSGWDHYLTGRYEEAQHLLDRATATLPDDVDPMRLMPLRMNQAVDGRQGRRPR